MVTASCAANVYRQKPISTVLNDSHAALIQSSSKSFENNHLMVSLNNSLHLSSEAQYVLTGVVLHWLQPMILHQVKKINQHTFFAASCYQAGAYFANT